MNQIIEKIYDNYHIRNLVRNIKERYKNKESIRFIDFENFDPDSDIELIMNRIDIRQTQDINLLKDLVMEVLPEVLIGLLLEEA